MSTSISNLFVGPREKWCTNLVVAHHVKSSILHCLKYNANPKRSRNQFSKVCFQNVCSYNTISFVQHLKEKIVDLRSALLKMQNTPLVKWFSR